MTSLASHAPVALQPLCDSKGRLLDAAIGWSSRPQVNCALHGHPGRRKRWNHWCITTPQWMLALTLADLDYLGYGAAYFLDLQTGQSVAHAQFRPFALGCQLPDAPLASHAFNHARLQLRVVEHPGLSENALWFGGEVQPLDSTLHIVRSSQAALAPWRLDSEDERVSLRFTPRQLHKARPTFGPFYADTQQHFGHYHGVLHGPKGERVPVDGALGWLGETHARR